MDRRVFMAVFLAILLSLVVVALLSLTLQIFGPFLIALLWAGVLAIVSYGFYERLVRWVGGRRTLAAAVMTLFVSFMIIGPVLAVLFVITEEAITLMASEDVSRAIETIEAEPWVQSALAQVQELAGGEKLTVRDIGIRVLSLFGPRAVLSASGGAVAGAVAVAEFVGTLLVQTLFTVFFIILSVFYFYRDGRSLIGTLSELLPLRPDDRATLFGDIRAAINASVKGGLVTAIAQGALGFVIVFILGAPRPLLWAAAMALASLIPIVGTSLVWLPLAGYWALNQQVPHALILVAYGVLVIGMADNFLRPLLVGRHMEAHPLPLFLGVFGGIMVFGFSGIILGPVAIAFLSVTTRLFRREFRDMGRAAQSATDDLDGAAIGPT